MEFNQHKIEMDQLFLCYDGTQKEGEKKELIDKMYEQFESVNDITQIKLFDQFKNKIFLVLLMELKDDLVQELRLILELIRKKNNIFKEDLIKLGIIFLHSSRHKRNQLREFLSPIMAQNNQG